MNKLEFFFLLGVSLFTLYIVMRIAQGLQSAQESINSNPIVKLFNTIFPG